MMVKPGVGASHQEWDDYYLSLTGPDVEYLASLWGSVLDAGTKHEAEYYSGRFDEYVAQNAIGDDQIKRAKSLARDSHGS